MHSLTSLKKYENEVISFGKLSEVFGAWVLNQVTFNKKGAKFNINGYNVTITRVVENGYKMFKYTIYY